MSMSTSRADAQDEKWQFAAQRARKRFIIGSLIFCALTIMIGAGLMLFPSSRFYSRSTVFFTARAAMAAATVWLVSLVQVCVDFSRWRSFEEASDRSVGD